MFGSSTGLCAFSAPPLRIFMAWHHFGRGLEGILGRGGVYEASPEALLGGCRRQPKMDYLCSNPFTSYLCMFICECGNLQGFYFSGKERKCGSLCLYSMSVLESVQKVAWGQRKQHRVKSLNTEKQALDNNYCYKTQTAQKHNHFQVSGHTV